MFRLLMRLMPVVFGLAAAAAAWLLTRPGGLFSLGNSPRQSAALAGIAFLTVVLLTGLPGFFYERARRKREREKAEAERPADDDEAMAFGPLPPIRPTAVTEARGPYVPQFADDDDDDAAPVAQPAQVAAPATSFAWPTMSAAELGQPDAAPEPPAPAPAMTPRPAPAAAPVFTPVPPPEAADPAVNAPIDELLMRRKADLAAALQRVSSPLAAVAASVELPVTTPPAERPPAPAPDPEPAPEPVAAVAPMPPLRQPDPRPAMPLPGMRSRIAAIRRELD